MDNLGAANHRWWSEDTVAVVTGANKGIGFAIVRQLAGHGIRVILTARDEKRGMAAATTLNDEGFHNVVFHHLDVQDPISIHEFANWMKDHYGKLDILVNNAAISGIAIDYEILKAKQGNPAQLLTHPGSTVEGISENFEMAKMCIDINYYGSKSMVEALIPLLKFAGEGGARIVNVSSTCGVLQYIRSESLRQQLSDLHNLTDNKIDAFLENFLHDFHEGILENNGWPVTLSAYFVSKAALNAYTRLLARQHPDLYVNCVNPGYVKTDMNFHTGVMSIEEGAEGPVMLALLPPGSPSGQYYDKTKIASFEVLDARESP